MRLMSVGLRVASLLVLLAAVGCQGSSPEATVPTTPAGSSAGLTSTPTEQALSQGTVMGDFVRVGGPAPGTAVPLTGTISFVQGSHSLTFPVGRDGRFTVLLPAGRYDVKGTSPQIQDGASTCSRTVHLTVIARRTITQRLVCDIK